MKETKLKTVSTTSLDGVPGTITFGLEYLLGNSDSHFTITGWYQGKNNKGHRKEFGGCCHDEILRKLPELKPFVDLHLSDSEGVPMYADQNGWYWLSGALGGLGEQYHGSSGLSAKSPEECLKIFADHVRIDLKEAQILADRIKSLYQVKSNSRQYFRDWIEGQKLRWKQDAESAIALMDKY